MGKNKNKSKSIKIRSIQANSLYNVNNYDENDADSSSKRPYLDLGQAVINDSLFSEYMKHHSVVVNSKGRSRDFIVMKFDYGVKGGMSSKELRDYYYKNGASVTWPVCDKDGDVKKKDTIHYKMLMRNPGKAKEGDCIFIRDNLHEIALKYITMNLWEKMPYDNAKIVEMSAYAPLVTATALDYITIPLENILIVEDKDVFTKVNAVSVKTKNVPHTEMDIDWDAIEEYINEKYNCTFYKKKLRDNPDYKYIRKTKEELDSNGIEISDYPKKEKIIFKKECYVERPEATFSNHAYSGGISRSILRIIMEMNMKLQQ